MTTDRTALKRGFRGISRYFFALPMLFALSGNGMAAPKYWLDGTADINSNPGQLALFGSRIETIGNTDTEARKASWSAHQPVDGWNDKALELVVKYRTNPLRTSRLLTYLHAAMQDAFVRADNARLGKTAQLAAMHISAATMLAHFFPLETPGSIEALGASALSALSSESKPADAVAAGVEIGKGVAHLAILRALNDGADEVWDPRTRPADRPGMWRATPPLNTAHPQEPLAGEWKTWALKDGAEIQPPPPPSADDQLKAANEVLEVRRNLTAQQKQIAEDWHLDQGTVTPPGVWNRKALELANRRRLVDKDRLMMLAALNVAMLDASIACWHAKYTWWVQRPVTVIQERMDETFMPYLVTPPHPSYVSNHASVSGAAAEVLKRFFPKDARLIDGWAEEAAMSRLYGGIHYRFDNEKGLALGRRIGKIVLERAPSQKKPRT